MGERTKMKPSVYQVVTDRIIEALEKGVVPWRQPWAAEAPKNLVSKKEYRGVNVLLLGAAAKASPWWLTFNQAKALGGNVKKGEKGTPVVFWKVYDKEDDDGDKDRRFVLRYYTVFNASQCEGIEVPASPAKSDPIEACEKIAAGYANGPKVQHGGDRAFYSPSHDLVQVPARESFKDPEHYYSTLFHELTHSTGAADRLDRKGITDPIQFASHEYSFEELVAECGAAFLCSEAGIATATLDDSAAYLAHWVGRLKSEPRWIVEAASKAAKAADLVLGRQAKPVETDSVPDLKAA
jgi:antirestriction protein ArdC